MAHSNRLRLRDIRLTFRLVGECLDLGRDPAAWLARAADGMTERFDFGPVCGTVQPPSGFLAYGAEAYIHSSSSFNSSQRERWFGYIKSGWQWEDPAFLRFRQLRERRAVVTLRRAQLVADRDFYASREFHERRRPIELDDYLATEIAPAGGAAATMFNAFRLVGERRFTGRDVRKLQLFHVELSRLLGGRLALGPQGLLAGLPPRLRRTLECLLEGDSEKQAALKLGVSRHTVHDYVQMLYRHYHVASRAELLARFIAAR